MAVTVGELDTPIQLQSVTYSNDSDYGGIQSQTWTAASGISTVWAYMIWKGGKESEEGEQKTGETKVEFYIRYETYKDAILPNWRIKHTLASGTAVYFYIEGIAHIDGRHRYTRLTAIDKDNK
jgi:head-tail adaptor